MQPPKTLGTKQVRQGLLLFDGNLTSFPWERVTPWVFPRPHRSARYWHPPPVTLRQDGRTPVPSQDECKRFCQSNHWWGSLKICRKLLTILNLKTLIFCKKNQGSFSLLLSLHPTKSLHLSQMYEIHRPDEVVMRPEVIVGTFLKQWKHPKPGTQKVNLQKIEPKYGGGVDSQSSIGIWKIHIDQVKGMTPSTSSKLIVYHICGFRVGPHAPRFCVAESRCKNDRSERNTSDSHTNPLPIIRG